MTQVTLFWGKENLVGIETKGHTGRAARGEDVVCAAVSALTQALLLGLREVAQVRDLECVVEPSVPLIRVLWTEARSRELDLLTRTVALSLKEIASGYAGYLCVVEVEVS